LRAVLAALALAGCAGGLQAMELQGDARQPDLARAMAAPGEAPPDVATPGEPPAALPEKPTALTEGDISQPTPAEESQPRTALRELAKGIASWYGPRFHGRRTASGERFDQEALTAAHRTLPFGTIVRVQSLVNGRTVDVRINDRGPFLRQRVIDLSRGAARALGLIDAGTGVKPVLLSIVEEAGGNDGGK
jgi:rare lipoprotein A